MGPSELHALTQERLLFLIVPAAVLFISLAYLTLDWYGLFRVVIANLNNIKNYYPRKAMQFVLYLHTNKTVSPYDRYIFIHTCRCLRKLDSEHLSPKAVRNGVIYENIRDETSFTK